MNINDLYNFSLGQYGSVSLDNNEQLSLLGSSKYLIGAIHIVSNRESSSIDNSFKYLVADDLHPLYWGTHSGGSMVLQFEGANVDSTNDTIKVNNIEHELQVWTFDNKWGKQVLFYKLFK